MADAYLERRQGPRVNVPGVQSDRGLSVSVRVLDIGLSGVSVASSQSFDVGQHARMSTRLGDCPIEVDVVVRRVCAIGGDKGGYKVSARFVSLDEATRQVMQRFLTGGNR